MEGVRWNNEADDEDEELLESAEKEKREDEEAEEEPSWFEARENRAEDFLSIMRGETADDSEDKSSGSLMDKLIGELPEEEAENTEEQASGESTPIVPTEAIEEHTDVSVEETDKFNLAEQEIDINNEPEAETEPILEETPEEFTEPTSQEETEGFEAENPPITNEAEPGEEAESQPSFSQLEDEPTSEPETAEISHSIQEDEPESIPTEKAESQNEEEAENLESSEPEQPDGSFNEQAQPEANEEEELSQEDEPEDDGNGTPPEDGEDTPSVAKGDNQGENGQPSNASARPENMQAEEEPVVGAGIVGTLLGLEFLARRRADRKLRRQIKKNQKEMEKIDETTEQRMARLEEEQRNQRNEQDKLTNAQSSLESHQDLIEDAKEREKTIIEVHSGMGETFNNEEEDKAEQGRERKAGVRLETNIEEAPEEARFLNQESQGEFALDARHETSSLNDANNIESNDQANQITGQSNPTHISNVLANNDFISSSSKANNTYQQLSQSKESYTSSVKAGVAVGLVIIILTSIFLFIR